MQGKCFSLGRAGNLLRLDLEYGWFFVRPSKPSDEQKNTDNRVKADGAATRQPEIYQRMILSVHSLGRGRV